MLRFLGILLSLLLYTWLSVACQVLSVTPAPETGSGEEAAGEAEPATLVLASHDSFNISEEVVAQFEETHNVQLQFLALGDAGEALNKVILSKGAPLADVFFGVDNTFLSRALAAEIFLPYDSPLLDKVPEHLQLDRQNRLLPVDHGFVNLNADTGWFAERDLPLPETLADLTRPEYGGLLVVQNPATSSPGLAFLLATIAHFGEDGYLEFWQALRENEVLVTDGWSEAYYDHFTVGSGGSGDRPLVVSYSTSPPADVVFAGDGRTEPASTNINPPAGTFHQIEFVGILQGTQQVELAQALVDFMLSRPFQDDIPLQMFVYPANVDAELPDVFVRFAELPAEPAELSPDAIESNREAWIQAWTDVMLR